MVKKIFFFVISIIKFSTIFGQTVSGAIATNTTWQTDTVYLTGDVIVNNGVTLTINAGTKVVANGFYKIIIRGRLLAVGTATRPIRFTKQDTMGLFNPRTTDGAWGGLRFDKIITSNDSSILKYCVVEYAKSNVTFNQPFSSGGIAIDSCSKILIQSSIIRNNTTATSGGGIYIRNASPVISQNNILNNFALGLGGGIAVEQNSNPIIEKNIIILNSATVYPALSLNTNPTNTTKINANIIANNGSIGEFDAYAVYVGSAKSIVTNNIIVNNQNGGISFGAVIPTNSILSNNTICNNMEGAGVFLAGSNTVKICNNIIHNNLPVFQVPFLQGITTSRENIGTLCYHNNIGDTISSFHTQVDNFDTLPRFVRVSFLLTSTELGYEMDWRLRENDSNIDKGTLLFGLDTIMRNEKDVYGNPRISNNRIDVGAAEYQNRTATSEIEKAENVKIYPNPFSGQLWIDLSKLKGNFDYKIINLNGQIIESGNLQSELNMFETNHYPNGTYILQIQNKEKQILSAKIQKLN